MYVRNAVRRSVAEVIQNISIVNAIISHRLERQF